MDLSLDKLKEAVSIREQIEALERRLNSLFGGSGKSSSPSARVVVVKTDGRRRPMSAATRAKLAAAARARWARRGAASPSSPAASTSSTKGKKRSKGGITPEGRRRLSEAMRARWAARRRAAGRK